MPPKALRFPVWLLGGTTRFPMRSPGCPAKAGELSPARTDRPIRLRYLVKVEEVVPLPAALTAARKQRVLALAGRRNAGENLSTATCRAGRFKLFLGIAAESHLVRGLLAGCPALC